MVEDPQLQSLDFYLEELMETEMRQCAQLPRKQLQAMIRQQTQDL